jgi:hypothetical protein
MENNATKKPAQQGDMNDLNPFCPPLGSQTRYSQKLGEGPQA